MRVKQLFYCFGLLLLLFVIDTETNATNYTSSPVRTISGEIVDITPTIVVLEIAEIRFRFPINQKAVFFCNGLRANWKALTPVYSGAFFEAQVSLDPLNNVILIKGNYDGEECVIKGWAGEGNKLRLELFSPEKQCLKVRIVKEDAHLPESKWLETDQIIYVLYNRSSQIRAVFMPE